jgi:hypothetical protein
VSNNPGDVEIGSVDVEGKDVSEKFVSMIFQEHLLSPFMRSNVRLNQYEGSQNDFDGSKDSSISFSTPDGKKRKYTIRMNGISDITSTENQRSRNFSLDFVSPHAILNNATPNYQKSFRNKQISSVIPDILKEGLGLNIPINIDDTKGLHGSDYQPIILTQKSPLKHIADLASMSISDKNYDGFLMFSGIGESGKEEFNFKNIYNILQKPSVATITNLTNYELNSDINNSMMNNAIEIFYSAQSSAMEKGAAFGTGTTRYDVNKAVADVPQLQYGSERQTLGNTTSLNPGKNSGFVTNPYNGMPGTSNIILEDSRRPDSFRAETAPYTQSLLSDMTQNFLTVKIPGNSNLKVGDIIDFDFRENTENFQNKDTKFYGKNLIIGLTNYIGPVNDSPRYVTYLDLVNIQTYNGKVK